MYEYYADVIRIIDGDTIEVNIDLGFNIQITQKIRVMAKSTKNFDTPETWRPKDDKEKNRGIKATNRARELLENERVTLCSVKKGKYRYVAYIKLKDGRDYGDVMVDEGFCK